MDALRITHVEKTFARPGLEPLPALKDVSLHVQEGTIHGLLGPNGAGKSTLINLLSGAMTPTSGSIEVFGLDVMKRPEAVKQMIGVVPQELVAEMAFTVEEVLYYFSGMYGVPMNERKERIANVLEDLSLSDKAKDRARGLSGGMKRRLMIAKAILHKPKLLVLDEPTAGVDVALRQKIWELVRRLHAEGTTILFTTHYLEEAEQLCKNITLVNHGTIITDGSLKELQERYSQNVIRFELFDRNVNHLTGVTDEGSEFVYPMTDLEKDLSAVTRHYQGNLKSIKNEAASLESIFLKLTA